MEMLNAYLQELRKHLPLKNREDIIEEIRSALMDMIEERQTGSDPDEATVRAVLMDYGPPRMVAQQYASHQSLIGPQIYPLYFQVLKIVLIVVAAVSILGVIVAAVSGSMGDGRIFITVFETFGGLLSGLFTAFGIVTLAFAMIERTTPEAWRVEVEEDWSPDDLETTENVEQVKVSELAIEITLGIVFIVLINVYLDRIGIYYLSDGSWISAPILNDSIRRYIPWLTATTALDIGLNLYLIRAGLWDATASVAKIILNIFKIAVLAAMIAGPALLTIDSAAWAGLNLELEFTAQRLSQMMNIGLDVLFGLAIFGLVVDSIKRLVQSFFRRNPSVMRIIKK